METKRELTKQGRNARTEYLRKWRREHPDKCRAYIDRYWSKRGAKETEEKGSVTNDAE